MSQNKSDHEIKKYVPKIEINRKYIDDKLYKSKDVELKNNKEYPNKMNVRTFGVNNSYKHHIKLFYDYLYLDKKIKEKDQEDNKKMKLSIIEDAVRVKSYGDKLKSYRELLVLIKKWNYLTGPTKGNDEKKMNNKFDSIIQEVKKKKKD
jgi:hypothetical protein